MKTSDAARAGLDRAGRHLVECRLCPRDCGVNRSSGQLGWCGAGRQARCYLDFVHYGEEAELAPSHTVYLTGCNLRCLFCHTAEERKTRPARLLTPAGLAELVARGRAQGARNLNILGGEPTVNLPALLELFATAEDLPPLVWNSNLYATAEALAMVEPLVDTYLPDLKFGNAACAARLAGAEDYWDVVRARLLKLPRARTIVRHLALPGHFDCCTRPALQWLAEAMPGVRVSLKLDYLVMPAARADAALGRFLRADEARQAREFAESLGLKLLAQAPPPADAPGEGPGSGIDVEMVISPEGGIYLRHPTREAAALARSLKGNPEPPRRAP